MKIRLGSNWDFSSLDALKGTSVDALFGKLPFDVVGGARPGFVLPQVDRNYVGRYIKACHERGLEFSYLLNAPCLGNLQYSKKGYGQLVELLEWIDKTYRTFDLDFLCDDKADEVIDTFMQRRGVGIKTISVVLMFACGKDIFPVDTHVHRICRRLGLVPENASAEKTHLLMQPLVPKGRALSLHINMLSLGRTLCKARNPNCPSCPLNDLCPSAALEKNNTYSAHETR